MQRFLDKSVWCPLSGFESKRGTIEPHKIPLMQAADDSIYARCPRHIAKVFIQDSMTIAEIMECSTVVRTKEKRIRLKGMKDGKA